MITIMPIDPEILQVMGEELSLTAEGPVWGYIASDGQQMLGYTIVEKAEPVRIIALKAAEPDIADGLLRRALFPFHEEGTEGYSFACEFSMPLPMVYTRRGQGSLVALFGSKCGGSAKK